MADEKGKLIEEQARKLELVKSLVEDLDKDDDVENTIRNASRCIREQGRTHELEVIISNRKWYDGRNSVKNEIREILGLKRLYLPGEEERLKEERKRGNYGTWLGYDCPPLDDSEYSKTLGKAKLLVLGEDQDTYIVIGTKSRATAYRLMRAYDREEHGLDVDEGVGYYRDRLDLIESIKLVWRKAYDEEEYDHYYNWGEKYTKGNPHAVDAFMIRF